MQVSTAPSYTSGDFVVYGGHGVGQVVDVETKTVAGTVLRFVVVRFEQEGMVLRVPFNKAARAGLRPVSSAAAMEAVLTHLTGPPAQFKGMWSRRLVELTAKINSGNPLAVAEVLRDLSRPANGKARSPAQQMLYEKALVRLGGELAAIDQTDTEAASAKLESLLLSAA